MTKTRAVAINDVYFMVEDCRRSNVLYLHYYSEQFKQIAVNRIIELNNRNHRAIEALFNECLTNDCLTDLAWYNIDP